MSDAGNAALFLGANQLKQRMGIKVAPGLGHALVASGGWQRWV